MNLYNMEGFQDYFYGYMVPSTGYLKYFELQQYEDGFVMVFPYEDTKKAAQFQTSQKLYHTLMEAAAWAKQMQISTIGELNEKIVNGKVGYYFAAGSGNGKAYWQDRGADCDGTR